MIVYDKANQPVCGICGRYWNDHALGGTCKHGPLTPEERADLISTARKGGK